MAFQPEDVGVKISRPLTSRFPVAKQTEILPVAPWTDANSTRPDLQSPPSDEEKSEPSGSPTAATNSQQAKDNSQLGTTDVLKTFIANEEVLSDVIIWQERKKPTENEIVVESPTAPQLSQLEDVVIVKKVFGIKFPQIRSSP